MALDAGTRLGPYDILSPLGQGGMGEVYMAQDSRLDRVVAIKVLPSDLAADPTARARFDREARAIAGLNHPNVCALFDVGRDRGYDFLVMELLEGETLQQRLDRGPLEIGTLVDFAIALADALDAAHTRGLIHRDLKPANIFITSRGVPKILDFGLAKALDRADDTTRQNDALTGLGTTLGTVAYMSPEQLRGETLDARTDLFSLGLVFYEMATGRRAFSGATSAVVSAGILGPDAPSPRSVRPDLPARLDDVIVKALEKDRNLRCQSAAELRADLMRIKREASEATRVVATSAATTTAMAAPASAPAPASPIVASAMPAAATPTATVTAVTVPAAATGKGPWIAVAALSLIVLIGGGYWWGQRSSTATVPPTSVAPVPAAPSPASTVPPPTAIPAAPAASTSAAAAPDRGAAPPQTPPAPAASRAEPTRGAVTPPPAATRPATPPVSPPPASPATQPPPAAADANPTGRPGGRGRAGAAQGAGQGRGGRGGRNLIGPAASALVAQLKALPPQQFHVVFLAGNLEAREFAFQWQGMLKAGGWVSSGVAPTEDAAVALGIGVPQPTQAANVVRNWAMRNGLAPDFHVFPNLKEIHIIIGAQK
jgi:hypothetical protein